MGAPSTVAVSSANISLTGATTYSLDLTPSDVVQKEQEIDYSHSSGKFEVEPFTAATEEMAQDRNFIEKILQRIREILKSLGYSDDKINTIVNNMDIMAPALIRICDYSEDLQKNMTVDEYKIAVENALVEFGSEEVYLLSKGKLNQEEVVEVTSDMLSDLMAGKTFAEIYEEEQKKVFISMEKSAVKKLINNFIKKVCKEYSDEVTVWIAKRFFSRYGDDAVRILKHTIFNDKSVFYGGMLTDIFFGGINDIEKVASTAGKYSSKKGLSSVLDNLLEKVGLPTGDTIKAYTKGTAAALVPKAGCGQVPLLTRNLLSNVSKSGFNVQGRYAKDVSNFLKGDSIWRKIFVPKNVTTTQQFAQELAKNTSLKAIGCKALGAGVTSLVVGSVVSFAFEGGAVAHDAFVEAKQEGKSTVQALGIATVEGAKAGWKKVEEDFPKNCAIAAGTMVGQVVGSVAGAAIGGAIGGPVGAYIGEKVGGFLGSLVGGFIGEAVYNSVTTKTDHGEKCWYKPWTWF